MAKKRPVKKKPSRPARPAKAAKPAKSKPSARSAPRASAPSEPAVVLFTLRDAGASSVRYHSDHESVDRARGVAQALANSPDVAEAFVLRADIVRGSDGT